MKLIKLTIILSLGILCSACTIVEPYQINFATPEGMTLNIYEDTLDLNTNNPTLVHLTHVKCEDLEVYPVPTEDLPDLTSHSHQIELDSLKILSDQVSSNPSKCLLTVEAYDRSSENRTEASLSIFLDFTEFKQ